MCHFRCSLLCTATILRKRLSKKPNFLLLGVIWVIEASALEYRNIQSFQMDIHILGNKVITNCQFLKQVFFQKTTTVCHFRRFLFCIRSESYMMIIAIFSIFVQGRPVETSAICQVGYRVSKLRLRLFVTLEIPITVSRRAPDKEARPGPYHYCS